MSARVVLLHAGDDAPRWASVARAVAVPLPARAGGPGADAGDATLAGVLADAECVVLDADTLPDPLATARRVHGADPEVQAVVVVPTEAQRRVLERALVFAPGVGELWLASPDEVAGGIAERAAGVTRQRRRFRRTRERLERERLEASPQRRERAEISDAYLANLLQVLPDAVFSVDVAGRILFANPAAGHLLPPGVASLVGASLGEVLGTGGVLVAEALAATLIAPTRRTVTFRRADGSDGHGELFVVRVAGSEPALFAALLHDLTERHRAQWRLEEQAAEMEAQAEELHAAVAGLEARTQEAERARAALAESEQQFRTLADAIPTLAWTAQPDGYVDWYNARWYAYTGTTPEQMEGWGWQVVHDPAVLPDVVARWRASIAAGEPFEMTFPLRGVDGRFRPFLTRVMPVKAADGRVVRWFGTNTDVEGERAARAEAERQREAAEEANRAKSEFLSTMSHELRTPLNAIQGYTDLLALGVRGPVTPEQVEDLDRVRRANRHLMSLITDILNFARLEAGRVEYHLVDVEVAPFVADMEALVVPQLAAKALAFDHAGCAASGSGGPYRVRADAEKLRQVLLNLLTNAIKFTDPGGRITLACEADPAAGVVHLHVSDTGRGIPADQCERIFEAFVQVDRHRTMQSQQGVGLGLAISRELARGMGGELTVESTPGVGSTFTLTLPRAMP